MAADPAQLVKRYDRLYADQANYRTTWQDLVEFFRPYRGDITTVTAPGTRRTQRLFDSEGVTAARTLSSNILGAVANQAQEWYSIRVREDSVNTMKSVRDWCEAITSISLAALASSNFYTELSEVMADLPIFGVGGLYCDEKAPVGPNRWGGLHYVAHTIGHNVYGENADGRVDTTIRRFEWPAAEVAKMWKDTCSEKVRGLAQDAGKQDELIKLLHAVYPRDVYGAGARAAKNKRFASCYLEHDTKTLLGEGGYDENPHCVGRWEKASPGPYGWGPGSIAYPDVRTLNRYVELDLQARGKAVDPPLLQRSEAVLGSLSLEPAAINIVVDEDPATAVVALESKARFDVNADGIQRLERKISQVFYGPLLREITKDMTATEAWIIQDETLRLLGPAAGRMQTELLGQAIERTIAILFRAGQLPPAPDELLQSGFDVDLDIVYEGPLARAQKSRDLVAIERKNAWVAQVFPIKPEVVDLFDWDKEASHVADVCGYPSDLVVSDDLVAAIRQNRAKAEAAQTKLGVIAGAAESIGKAGPGIKAIAEAGQAGQPQPAQGAAA